MSITLTFHGNPLSSNSQKVHYFLEEAGIPYQARVVDLRKGEQLRPDYRAVNPFEAVPAIELGGFRLAESNTILRYLAKRYDKSDWYPVNLEDQARVDQAMDFVTLQVGRWILTLQWNSVIAPMMGLPVNKGMIDEAHHQLVKWLPRFERYMAGTTAFLCGPRPTIADAAFAPPAALAKRLGVPIADFPLVNAYIDRLGARPAWQKVAGEAQKMLAGK